jgi:flagellar biogenesis protein FliO
MEDKGKVDISWTGDPKAMEEMQTILKEGQTLKGCVHLFAIVIYIVVLIWLL